MNKFSCVLLSVVIALFGIILLRPNNSCALSDNQYYIAHGAGQIDGYNYTNSLEAFEHSIQNGIKYIELDFCVTADGYLVAAHDWTHYN